MKLELTLHEKRVGAVTVILTLWILGRVILHLTRFESNRTTVCSQRIHLIVLCVGVL